MIATSSYGRVIRLRLKLDYEGSHECVRSANVLVVLSVVVRKAGILPSRVLSLLVMVSDNSGQIALRPRISQNISPRRGGDGDSGAATNSGQA